MLLLQTLYITVEMSRLPQKKPSGAEYRKRKKKQDDDAKKSSKFMQDFLASSRPIPESDSEEEPVSECEDIGESGEQARNPQSAPTVGLETEDQPVAEDQETQHELVLDYGDPATWPLITDDLRQILVEHGPEQAHIDFPFDEQDRKFSDYHYRRILANGEVVHRQWLQYSESKDTMYCFCCKLFSTKRLGLRSSLAQDGYRNWHNASATLSFHENSQDHLQNFKMWKEMQLRLRANKTIDEDMLRDIRREEEHWRQVLERLIALVKVMGGQNMAFRGSDETLYALNNGNFLKLVEYLALFDPVMNEHLRRIRDNETHVHYLGKNIQNELIQFLSNTIREKLIKDVKAAKYFSIILDCTPDASHIEQMTMIIRFVDTNTMPENEDESVNIREHFFGFVPMEESTGLFITDTLLKELENLSLNFQDLRGQGYDNGSNMKGKDSGVQKRILDLNPRALFVPCSAHSLNLVVNDAARSSVESTNFFDLAHQVYVFFAGSTRRWDKLTKHVKDFTVKRMSDTRWESRVEALKPLRYQLGDVYDALMDIHGDKSFTGSSGNTTRTEAKNLAESICKFDFIVSLVVWYDILFAVNISSKILQDTHLDVDTAIDQLQATKEFLTKRRSEEKFQDVLVASYGIAEELEIEDPKFAGEGKRVRKAKRQFEYEGIDNPIRDAKEKFKVEFYYRCLDTAINSVEERFEQLQNVRSIFGFICNIYDLRTKTEPYIRKHCLTLEKALQHGESKDIDAMDLCNELQVLALALPKRLGPKDVLNFLCINHLTANYPNTCVALRILLTLPVSVASGERSFSKLKLIKTYLRTTMSQERLVGLATLSIEKEVANTLDLKEQVSSFAKMKARKVLL